MPAVVAHESCCSRGMTDPKRAPRTPLLLLMLFAVVVMAVGAWVTGGVEMHLAVAEPIVVSAMIAAASASRIVVR